MLYPVSCLLIKTMEEVILEAQLRQERKTEKPRSIRQQGAIPAVICAVGKDSQSVKLSRHDFLHFIHQHHMESTVINLKIEGEKSRTVLVKDVQYDAVKGDVIHIDFQEISLTSKIKVNVGIVSKGEAIGVKQDNGVLNHMLWELEIECLATQIPEEVIVDVAPLKIGDAVHVRDLSLPEGIRILNDPDSIVFSVEPPAKEEEIQPAPIEGEQPAEPEVIKEKKEPEGEGEKEKEKEKE